MNVSKYYTYFYENLYEVLIHFGHGIVFFVVTLEEKSLWFFSEILSKFVRILVAFSERRQSNSISKEKPMNSE